jgi:hypothetical protein
MYCTRGRYWKLDAFPPLEKPRRLSHFCYSKLSHFSYIWLVKQDKKTITILKHNIAFTFIFDTPVHYLCSFITLTSKQKNKLRHWSYCVFRFLFEACSAPPLWCHTNEVTWFWSCGFSLQGFSNNSLDFLVKQRNKCARIKLSHVRWCPALSEFPLHVVPGLIPVYITVQVLASSPSRAHDW